MNYRIVESLYYRDIAILKKYNDNTYKLSLCRFLRKKGYELNKKRITGVNNAKLDNNISRAKSKVLEYALCNKFDYFVTLTIDKTKFDRYKLKEYYKDFSKWLNNYNRLHNTKIKYILIPEQHKDGAWHMHGLMSGIQDKHLYRFTLNDNIPRKIKDLIIAGDDVYSWTSYVKKYGYITLTKIKSVERVSRYITKYINKNMANSIKDLGAHMYYCSKGLNVAVEIKRGVLYNTPKFDFENDYVKIKWLKKVELNDLLIE